MVYYVTYLITFILYTFFLYYVNLGNLTLISYTNFLVLRANMKVITSYRLEKHFEGLDKALLIQRETSKTRFA